jgi:hypothetical protein
MLRKLILSAVLATGAIAGIAMPAGTANAAEPFGYNRDRDFRDHRNVRFEVKVRHRGHWDTYGTYHSRIEAQRVVWMLERQGRDARIDVERGW